MSALKHLNNGAQQFINVMKKRSLIRTYLPFMVSHDQEPFWHLCIAHVDWNKLGNNRVWLFDKMKEQGISLQVHYIPLHHQPMLSNCRRASNLHGADVAYSAVVSLPCFPALTEAEQESVISALLNL